MSGVRINAVSAQHEGGCNCCRRTKAQAPMVHKMVLDTGVSNSTSISVRMCDACFTVLRAAVNAYDMGRGR